MRYGVIDIGSNSIKFLIAEKKGESLTVILEQSHTTRLAEELITTTNLKPEAVNRTLELFTRLRSEGERLGVNEWMAVATSAVRDAGNRKEFLRAAAERLTFNVRLLSGEEEAETIYLGVSSDKKLAGRDILVVDVGGGSAEWIQGKASGIERRLSLPLGCVRLRERFIEKYPIVRSKVDQMLQALEEQLTPVLRDYRLNERILIGTGGTITALAAILQKLPEYDASRVHLYSISWDNLHKKMLELADLTSEQLMHTTGLPAKRADIIVPGIAVFCVTMRLLKVSEISVSTRGLRYGVLERLVTASSKQAVPCR